MAQLTSVLINPETCARVRIETGLYVGKKSAQGTLQEWLSDARYERHGRDDPRVTRLDRLDAAERALQVREDELLSAGYVLTNENTNLAMLLAHHDPWKTWLRAKDSPAPLVELWKGLAPQAALERPKVSVASVGSDALVLATRAGRLTCQLPLHPEQLGEVPSFLVALLVRHFALSGAISFFCELDIDGHVLTAGTRSFAFDAEAATLTETDEERVLRESCPWPCQR